MEVFMFSRIHLLLFVLFLFTALGCSSRELYPVTPDLSVASTSISPPKAFNNLIPWGIWEVILDPAKPEPDIVPLRTLQFTANVTRFMQPPSSKKHLLGIAVDNFLTDWTTGHVVVDVSFTHPFPGLDTYTGFDVRGVCIGNGSIPTVSDPGVIYAGEGDLRVLNADGFTRWFNPSEFTTYGTIFGFTLGKLGTPSYNFTATLNGYKYFCHGLDKNSDLASFFSDPSCPNPRGYFPSGATLVRRYDLQFPAPSGTPQYKFQYAIVASWLPPDIEPPTNIPDDFSISANCAEAYLITATDQSTLYYVNELDKGGDLILDLTVYDHQGVLNSAGVSDEVAAIHLETQNGLIIGNLATFEGVSLDSALVESNEKYARYILTVPQSQTHPTAPGDYPVLIAVESSNPDSYDPGYPGFVFPPGRLASYLFTKVKVSSESTKVPPVAVAKLVDDDNSIFAGQSLQFDGTDSYDPDGTIVSWQWDSDDDGVYDDAVGPTPTIQFPNEGVFHVDLKVTDNDGLIDTLDEPIEVVVSGKVIHVDDDNINGPWDGSPQHPFLIIQDGINAVPDDTGWMVYVHEGTYITPRDNPSDPYSGGMVKIENKHNVTLFGEEGAVIYPPSNLYTGYSAIRVRNGSTNITIDGFSIHPRYAYQSAIWCESVNGLTIKNCALEPPNESYGFLEFARTQNCTNVLIKNNMMDTFNSASSYMSVFVISGGSNVTISGNTVVKLNNLTGGNIDQTGEGYVGFYNVNGGEISKNKFGQHSRVFESTNYVEQVCIRLSGCSNIVVRNNLIYDTRFQNSVLSGESRNVGIRVTNSNGIQIYHNTIDRLGPSSPSNGLGYTYGVWVESGSVTEFHSNIISNTWAPGAATCYGVWSNPILLINYSDIYGVVGGTTGLYGGNASPGVGYISADPLYVDPSNYDYHLLPTSPCKGTGKNGEDMGCYGGADPLE